MTEISNKIGDEVTRLIDDVKRYIYKDIKIENIVKIKRCVWIYMDNNFVINIWDNIIVNLDLKIEQP